MRELGINLLGVQEARAAAGARVVNGYVVLASGADRGTLGCELLADTEMPYASVDGRGYFFRQYDFVAVQASPRGPRVLVVRVAARCLQCINLLLRMHHIRALMLPTVICGGRICHAGLLASLTLCFLLMPMLVWALLCLPLLAVEACANRRTLRS